MDTLVQFSNGASLSLFLITDDKWSPISFGSLVKIYFVNDCPILFCISGTLILLQINLLFDFDCDFISLQSINSSYNINQLSLLFIHRIIKSHSISLKSVNIFTKCIIHLVDNFLAVAILLLLLLLLLLPLLALFIQDTILAKSHANFFVT